MVRREVVSSASEELVLVDELDREVGFKPKSECHIGSGILHRAFSIFVFNSRGELLLQKRSSTKPLWPNFWSNTCCSHPRRGELMEHAVSRRLVQELGFECPLSFLYKFKYHAQFGEVGAEREYCWVYYGKHDGRVDVNAEEIADWRFVQVEALDEELAAHPERFTPWFKLEWAHIKQHHLEQIREEKHPRARNIGPL